MEPELSKVELGHLNSWTSGLGNMVDYLQGESLSKEQADTKGWRRLTGLRSELELWHHNTHRMVDPKESSHIV